MARTYIDLNSDVGEGVGNENELLPLLSSCNIACGGHTGDKRTMTQVVRLAKAHNVAIGAHPSYPDRSNFGRSSMKMDAKALMESIKFQVQSLVRVIKTEDARLSHIKPHGALYNDIAKDSSLALCFLKSIEKYKDEVSVYAPYGSAIAKEAVELGFKIKYEAFADRNYEPDLSLVSRQKPNALIIDKEKVLAHVVKIAKFNRVRTMGETEPSILADTFCIHGDTPSALEIVLYLTKELPNHNIYLKSE